MLNVEPHSASFLQSLLTAEAHLKTRIFFLESFGRNRNEVDTYQNADSLAIPVTQTPLSGAEHLVTPPNS